jgi:hypothetical protein
VKKSVCRIAWSACALGLLTASYSAAQPSLLAVGTLDQSRAGSFADLSGLKYTLENGAPANLLGGLGSALAYANGYTFLALPDRGPNAVTFDPLIDNTASYVNRFHTITMDLGPNTSGALLPPYNLNLPYKLTPTLRATTLLWSLTPLVYGTGSGLGVGSGAPPINNFLQHFFTGRSDNFDPSQNSGNPKDARFDTEGMRVSNDGLRVYISDEYGPYVYEFDRLTGVRLRSFQLPSSFYVTNLSPVGATEISGNTSGRTANKGMEGLAITPDGKTLVGIMQNALIQDASEATTANPAPSNLLRIVTIDILSGHVTHQYACLLTAGSGVSEICAINNHEFLVDERDGKGREGKSDGSSNAAAIKQLFKIDLNGAVDVSDMDGIMASAHAVNKTLFLDIVSVLTGLGVNLSDIPAKIEGVASGPDIKMDGKTIHTLWIANDNDFLSQTADVPPEPNDNDFFVFGFTDADLKGSELVPQQFRGFFF